MKWLNVKQGSEEWRSAHLGIPSASQFERILSPKKLQPSAQSTKYLCELVAERITGHDATGDGGSLWMERGTALEAEAAAYYELTTGRSAQVCGFALTDDGRVGASPDRLVGTEGLLEIKCPSAAVHISYLLYGLADDYRLQLQGQLLVTGRGWVDFLSHCPGFPPVQHRVSADHALLPVLRDALRDFCAAVDGAEAKVRAMLNQEVAA